MRSRFIHAFLGSMLVVMSHPVFGLAILQYWHGSGPAARQRATQLTEAGFVSGAEARDIWRRRISDSSRMRTSWSSEPWRRVIDLRR
jgi:hypothetical protein